MQPVRWVERRQIERPARLDRPDRSDTPTDRQRDREPDPLLDRQPRRQAGQGRWPVRPLRPSPRSELLAAALVGALGIGCAHPAAAGPPPEQRTSRVYAYPAEGQSPLRQDRDRYECYRWARRRTGYDPGLHAAPPRERVRVVSTRPPVHDTFAGAAVGALIGAASTHHHGEGAAIGAAIGAAVGAVSDAHREHTRRRLETELTPRVVEHDGASDYRRAMSACLAGRGYSVQ